MTAVYLEEGTTTLDIYKLWGYLRYVSSLWKIKNDHKLFDVTPSKSVLACDCLDIEIMVEITWVLDRAC